ncbi:sugar phosphate isomerase/epimerase family protein [Clostridium beijerinckii]|uniref:Sugar phosphate isomerase/epimerase n=1 Tax=Clostridium beijerinckii TaxID=1520 RepID=A0A7X9SRJ9_CLOBE|nr:sugar phosphate isomerase/epimerase [Clostridium beijerinckii]NMF06699.1 sugar phosphate isomerase/epimerase [Clostridium beijerinckii]
MNQLGINLLVFKNELDKGIKQQQILEQIEALGVHIAEIRRECLKNLAEEILIINKLAKKFGIELYYSVPEKVAFEKKLNPDINVYFEEAKLMGATHIKFNIGDLVDLSLDEIKKLRDIIDKFEIKVTIENDQTPENGNLKCVVNAIDIINKNSLPIGYTFDLGNWYWQNEDPENAFDILRSAITVFHLKNVEFLNNKPTTTLLSKGQINWKAMLKKLSNNVPVIIEYPIRNEDIRGELEEVRKILL